MARPAPAFAPLVVSPTLTTRVRVSVLEAFPDVAAFVRDLYREKQGTATLSTILGYARRIAHAAREGRLAHPELCAYALESTAVNAYWAWVGHHYEKRVYKAYDVMAKHEHHWRRAAAPLITTGSLARPWPGKQILSTNPWLFPETGKPVYTPKTTDCWTLHIPQMTREGTARLPPHSHEDPHNLCAECEVIELQDVELQALAEAFYDAWGADRDPYSMPIDTPLFGRSPLRGDFAAATAPSPVGVISALIPTHTPLESLLMRFKSAEVTPSEDVFVDRLEKRSPDIVVLEREIFRNASPDKLRDVFKAIWRWATPVTVTETTPPPASIEEITVDAVEAVREIV